MSGPDVSIPYDMGGVAIGTWGCNGIAFDGVRSQPVYIPPSKDREKVVVNLPDKPSEVQDVNLTVDGVTGTNSDPDLSAEAEGTSSTVHDD